MSLYNNHLNGILADEMGLGKPFLLMTLYQVRVSCDLFPCTYREDHPDDCSGHIPHGEEGE